MKSAISWINILVCLTVLALISTACQSIAPAASTPTTASTDTPAPTAAAYPQPYPYPLLPTYDPYLPPALPDPYAYPVQGAPSPRSGG
jgi:hypothetical protein